MLIAFYTFMTLIAAVVALTLYWPWIQPSRRTPSISPLLNELRELEQARAMAMANLKDLEGDLQMNKLEQADYESLREKFLLEAGSVYQSLEKLYESNPTLKTIMKESE